MKSSSRYRHPGDAIRLIGSIVLLLAAVIVTAVTSDRLLGPDATSVRGVTPSTSAGRLLVGLVQLVVVVVIVAVLFAVLAPPPLSTARQPGVGRRSRRARVERHRAVLRPRAACGARRQPGPRRVVRQRRVPQPARARRRGSRRGHRHPMADSCRGSAPPGSPWRIVAAARLISGTVLPMQLVLAFAVGATVGTGPARGLRCARSSPGARRRRRGAARPAASLSCPRRSPRSPERARVHSS